MIRLRVLQRISHHALPESSSAPTLDIGKSSPTMFFVLDVDGRLVRRYVEQQGDRKHQM